MSAFCPREIDMENVYELLTALRSRYNQREIADALGVTTRTLRRWEVRETDPPPYLADAIRQRLLPFGNEGSRGDGAFRFIDLFAGIGGIRMAFEAVGGECVFTSEWNTYAQKTYLANFPDSRHALNGDITKVDEQDIPDHDVLLAGFPCQPFSIAGVSKKNALGRAHGFADETQGTLFFDVARIIAAKRPAAFLLENVKNLVSHDKGNTFRVIKKVLEEELGYHISCKVIDGAHFVPQHRERILIVGFREKTDFDFADVHLPDHKPKMSRAITQSGQKPRLMTATRLLRSYGLTCRLMQPSIVLLVTDSDSAWSMETACLALCLRATTRMDQRSLYRRGRANALAVLPHGSAHA